MWFKRFCRNLKQNCHNITLHGSVNISESKSALEIIFWLVVQALCFGLCLWLMAIHWLRYQSRPTVTTIKSTAYPVSEITFPAVTICNTNVVHKRKIEYLERMLIREGVNETRIKEFFKNLRHLIHTSSAEDSDIIQFDEIENSFKRHEITSDRLMKSVMHPCGEMLSNCTWSSVKYNCSQMFKPIKTGLGFCCSFNYFNDITDQERDQVPDIFKEPVVAEGSGIMHGLSVGLKIDAAEYMSPLLPLYGCFVMVHPIRDFSDLATFSVALQPSDFALMQLIPTVFTAEDNLKSVSVEMRQCWFHNEGHLQSTKEYSFTNCVAECKKRAIYEFCKCVPYFYPTDQRRQCTLQDAPCLKKYELLYNSIKLSGKIKNDTVFCDCLPECEYVAYDGYVNTIRSSMPGNESQIYIYFDHSWCVEYNMSLNLTWDMLLASLGGIFGLCLGGSLISLIECVYYLVKSIVQAFLQGRQTSPTPIKVKPFNNKDIKGFIKFLEVQPKY